MYNSECQLCNLHKSSASICIPATLAEESTDVLVIGDAPSVSDANAGAYLQGKLGAELYRAMDKIGIEHFAYTGVVKCNPPDGKKPEPAEVKACSHYLQQEIARLRPKFVLVLGATAVKSVCKEARITGVVGKVIERDGIKYMPCFSPAYVLRDPGKAPEFNRTMARFRDMVRGKTQITTELKIRIIDRSNLDEFRTKFQLEREFVCDLETSGLDHFQPASYINCVGMYLPLAGEAWVLPIRKAPTLPEETQRRLLEWMSSLSIPVINQNWKFDSLFLYHKFGVSFYNRDDTMLAHYNLDENTPHGLKENARFHLDAPDYDLTTAEKKGNTTATKLFTYCAWDCHYTYQLRNLYRKDLMKDLETRNIYQHLTMPASRMYEVIEREGHFVNLDKFRATEQELSTKLKLAEAKLNHSLGHPINWNSPAQVGKALYHDLGLTPSVFTDKGAASTGEEALSHLDHPIVKQLVDYRENQKFLSTYIEGWKEFMIGPYLYLGTKLHGTVTGRYSSRLHQVPRDGTIRNLIEAPPGWTFVQGDLSQAELRVIAIVSQDPELVKCYRDGIDVHWRTTVGVLRLGGSEADLQMARETVAKTGSGMEPLSMSEVLDQLEAMGPDMAVQLEKRWKEKRKQSKGINFGYVYGMGANKFCEYAKLKYEWDVTFSESTNIRTGFFGTYHFLPAWHKRQRDLVKIDGFVRSLSGRKRRLPGIWSPDRMVSSEAERQAINSPVQGFIGDLKVMGMLDIYEKIQLLNPDKIRMKGEVHDSILMWVKTEYLDEILPQVKRCMEKPTWLDQFDIKLPVPIVADIEVGPWGAGKPWHGEKQCLNCSMQ